jgi:putative SOS response-associated peptidase YedK
MEQVHEEVVEREDEEDWLEAEEQEQQDIQVPPKTPNKRIQRNHPSDRIIGNKDARVETRRIIRS